MKKITLTLLLLFVTITAHSQIKIGQHVDETLYFLNYLKKMKRWSVDKEYKNGKVSEIIVYKKKQLYYDLDIVTDEVERMVIDDNSRYAYSLKQYPKLSLEYITKKFDSYYKKHKIKEYYFTKDYMHFRKLSLLNDKATIIYGKAYVDRFPQSIKNEIKRRLNKNSDIDYIEEDGYKRLNIEHILKRQKKSSNITGSYKFNESNVLKLVEMKNNEVLFSLDLFNGRNLGYLEGLGTLKKDTITFKNDEFGICEFTIKVEKLKATIVTVGEGSNCGFGNGVRSDKVYLLKSRKTPTIKSYD